MDYQISNNHKSIHYHLHSLRSIRNSLLLSIGIIISSSYILPLFDYSNNLFFNIPAYKLNKLQTLQNAVVRCVFSLPRRSTDSLKPLLKQLHWLPIIYYIKYKISLITHKVIHHNSPDYLVSLTSHPPTTNNTITRSSNTFLTSFISITPTPPVLVISHCQSHTIGTHYLPPFALSHVLATSNLVTLKPTSGYMISI